MKKVLVFVFILTGLVSKSQSLCAGSSITLTAAMPTTLSGQSYSITPGNASSPGGTFVVSPTVTTTYTLHTTGTTAANTQGTASVVTTVTVFQQPTVTPSYTNPTCTSTLSAFNLSLTFSPSGPIPSYTVTWATFPPSQLPNVPNGITTSTQYSATGVTPGPYGAVITSAGGCTTSVSFTMANVPAFANFTLNPAGSVFSITCYNTSVTLNATGDASNTYTWAGASIGQSVTPSITLNNMNLGTATVTASSPNATCNVTKTISVVSNTSIPQANITPTTQNITCNLSSIITVTATAVTPVINITHIFTPPQGGPFVSNTGTTAYAPQGGTGTYTHCLIDNINGCSICKTFTVTSNQGYPTFTVTSSPPNFTLGCSSKSLSTITILQGNTNPPGGAVSYSMLPPGSSSSTPSGSLSGINTYTVNSAGTFTFITKDNTSSCESRIPISVIQNTFGPLLDTILKDRNVLTCFEPTVDLIALSETPNISYNWATPGTPITNLPSSTLKVNANFTVATSNTLLANYTLTLKDNNNLCITTSVVPIYQNLFKPNVIMVSSPTVLTCKTPTVVITNQSTTGIPNNVSFPKTEPVQGYYWQSPSPQLPEQNKTTIVALTVGVYTLTGRDLNNGCLNTGTFAIGDGRDYPEVRTPSLIPQIDCGSPGATLTPIYPLPISQPSYTWTPPEIIPQGILTQSTVLAPAPGVYTLVVTNQVNGCATKFTMAVTRGTLSAHISANDTFGYAPLTVNFENLSHSANSSTTNILTVWDFGNGSSLTTKSVSVGPQQVYTHAGTYTVVAYVAKSPCLATDTILISVELPSKLEIPNVFTPNNDKVNDIFFLRANNLSLIDITIYDRWGTKVYELKSETNIAWDGKNQFGVECPAGAYFYKLNATGKDGHTWEEKGNITLIR